jgi:hypothetical protein
MSKQGSPPPNEQTWRQSPASKTLILSRGEEEDDNLHLWQCCQALSSLLPPQQKTTATLTPSTDTSQFEVFFLLVFSYSFTKELNWFLHLTIINKNSNCSFKPIFIVWKPFNPPKTFKNTFTVIQFHGHLIFKTDHIWG